MRNLWILFSVLLVGFAVAQWSLGCRWAPCFELLTAAVWAWIAWRRAGAVLYGDIERLASRLEADIRG